MLFLQTAAEQPSLINLAWPFLAILAIYYFIVIMPTRHARNGWLFTNDGHIAIKHAEYKEDDRPIDEACRCPVCSKHSRAYLRHLFMAGEILASVLNTIHNLYFYLDTMDRIRQFIEFRRFDELLAQARKRAIRRS